jgi:hypothetical protein
VLQAICDIDGTTDAPVEIFATYGQLYEFKTVPKPPVTAPDDDEPSSREWATVLVSSQASPKTPAARKRNTSTRRRQEESDATDSDDKHDTEDGEEDDAYSEESHDQDSPYTEDSVDEVLSDLSRSGGELSGDARGLATGEIRSIDDGKPKTSKSKHKNRGKDQNKGKRKNNTKAVAKKRKARRVAKKAAAEDEDSSDEVAEIPATKKSKKHKNKSDNESSSKDKNTNRASCKPGKDNKVAMDEDDDGSGSSGAPPPKQLTRTRSELTKQANSSVLTKSTDPNMTAPGITKKIAGCAFGEQCLMPLETEMATSRCTPKKYRLRGYCSNEVHVKCMLHHAEKAGVLALIPKEDPDPGFYCLDHADGAVSHLAGQDDDDDDLEPTQELRIKDSQPSPANAGPALSTRLRTSSPKKASKALAFQ